MGLLRGIAARALDAAVPVAGVMGKTYEDHLKDVTLVESGAHGPATPAGYPPSAPEGRPPMVMTGHLRASVDMFGPSGGGGVGESSVSPDTIYAATIEWGQVHHAAGQYMWLWLMYVGYREVIRHGWLKPVVTIGERPYMRTALAEELASGELQRTAEAAFEAAVWGG